MIEILNGREIAIRVQEQVKEMLQVLPAKPGMAAILVGNDPASHLYVSLKEKACKEVGIYFEKHLFASDISEDELKKHVQELNARKDIHGILVQLPLPNQDANKIIATIDPNKDIDGFHPLNLQRLENHEPSLVSPVALGVMQLVDLAKQKGARIKTATLVCSEIFGKPLNLLLQEQNIESQIIALSNSSLSNETKKADLIIVATGKPGTITGEMIKKSATIIDIGTTKVDGKIVGDADASVFNMAGFITPVPGGVGPVTVAMLVMNVVKAFHLQEN